MSHTKFKLGLLGVTCALLTGCSNDSSVNGIEESVEYLPVRLVDSQNWSFINSKGEILAENEFDNCPTAVVNGMFCVQDSDAYGIYNINNPKNAVLSQLVSVGAYNEDVIPVTRRNDRISLADKTGHIKATIGPVDGKEILYCSPFSEEGMITIVDEDKNYGYVDSDGRITLKPQYKFAGPFAEGIALVVKCIDGNDHPCVIDKTGKELFPIPNYTPLANQFKDGLLPLRDDGKKTFGFINTKNEITEFGPEVEDISTYNAKYFVYKNGGGWGVMNMKGEPVIETEYYNIAILPDGNFFVTKQNDVYDFDYFIFNKKGEKETIIEGYQVVANIVYDHFEFLGVSENKFTLLNKKGKQVGNKYFTQIEAAYKTMPFVSSDFFNPEIIVEALTAPLEMGGIGSYKIGTPVTALGITDYEKFIGLSRIDGGDLNKQGLLYSSNINAYTDETIAFRKDGNVAPNSNAKIESISFTVKSSRPCWNSIKDTLISKISEKGYTMTESTDSGIKFSGKECVLNLIMANEGNDITITVSTIKKAPVKSNTSNIKNNGQKKKKNTDDSTDWMDELIDLLLNY